MNRDVGFALITILLLSCLGHAQSVEDLKKCVAFLFGRVHVKDPNRGGDTYGFAYLVTAKHVLKDVDDTYLRELKVRVNLKKLENDSDLGIGKVTVSEANGKLLWFDDKDDPQNDVAVLPLLPDPNKVDIKVIPIGLFADDELLSKQNVTEGDSLYLFGLMPQYYGEKKNYPVVRRGSLALLTNELIQTGPNTKQHAYLAEMGSWPGNSGAPVFAVKHRDQLHTSGFEQKQVPRLRRTIRFTNRPTSLGMSTVWGLPLRRTLPNR